MGVGQARTVSFPPLCAGRPRGAAGSVRARCMRRAWGQHRWGNGMIAERRNPVARPSTGDVCRGRAKRSSVIFQRLRRLTGRRIVGAQVLQQPPQTDARSGISLAARRPHPSRHTVGSRPASPLDGMRFVRPQRGHAPGTSFSSEYRVRTASGDGVRYGSTVHAVSDRFARASALTALRFTPPSALALYTDARS